MLGSSLRDTHRATDGLSGKLDRLQGASERMAEARAKLTPHTSSWPQMDRATNDFHNALNALDHDDCLKLIEAARASQVGMSEANEPSKDEIIQRQGEEIERLRGDAERFRDEYLEMLQRLAKLGPASCLATVKEGLRQLLAARARQGGPDHG